MKSNPPPRPTVFALKKGARKGVFKMRKSSKGAPPTGKC